MRRLPERETLAPRHFAAPGTHIGNAVERSFLGGALWRRGVGGGLTLD